MSGQYVANNEQYNFAGFGDREATSGNHHRTSKRLPKRKKVVRIRPSFGPMKIGCHSRNLSCWKDNDGDPESEYRLVHRI